MFVSETLLRRPDVDYIPAAKQSKKKKNAWLFEAYGNERWSAYPLEASSQRTKEADGVGFRLVKSRERLNEKAQFRNLHQNGRKIDAESFRMIFRKNDLSHSRFGVIVNRRFGSAVCRNEAKRKLRSLFDLFRLEISPPCDLLLFPKKAMLERQHESLVTEFKRALFVAEIIAGK
jgi:ribonuclease P protein component